MSAPKNSKLKEYATTLSPITCAAGTTAFVMYPVDVVRALRMANADKSGVSALGLVRSFVQVHGWSGFFRQGVFPELAKATAMRISKWFLFPVVHELIFQKPATQGTAFTKSISGGLCVLPETFVIAPFELAKIALQLDTANKFNNSGRSVVRHLLKENGWKSVFIGFGPLLWRQVTFSMVLFGTIGKCSSVVQPVVGQYVNEKYSKTVSTIIAGFSAGVLGTLVNCSGDVIRTVQQKQALANLKREPLTFKYFLGGVTEGFKVGGQIYRTNGLAGLYRGLGFKSLHLGGSNALMPTFILLFSNAMGINYKGL